MKEWSIVVPEQETSATASSQSPLSAMPWRVRVCRWLFRVLLYVWGTLLVGIVVGTIANINTTTTDTPLSKLFVIHLALTFPIPVFSSLGLLVLLTLLSWMGSRNRDTIVSPSPSEQNRTHLLRRLRLRYEQVLTQSLQGAVRVELGLTSRPAAVQNAVALCLRLPHQPEQLLPPHTSISEAYELAQQELLILGEPGAGKSTLLLELALHLTQQAEQDVTQPLPILLPLSTWAVKRLPLKYWFIEQCAFLYDIPRSLSQQWMEAEKLLPLLDGLDEMERSARAACIAAINTYHREYLQPLVVCSRTNEYETAARHECLSLHNAVVVLPLSKEQIDAHLVSIGKPVAVLSAAYRKNPLLQELATTPLMLQILLLAYHGISVWELSPKETLLRKQIWDDYVQRMISRKGAAERYPLHVTRAWLSWLAQEMREHNQTIFYLEQLQPDWLPKGRRTFYRWSLVLVSVLVGVLVSLPFGVLFGMLVGVLAGVLVNGLTELQLALLPYDRILLSVVKGLFNGLVVGLFFGLFSVMFGRLDQVLFGVLFGGLGATTAHYILRFWLWRTHIPPWRVVSFLDDATARILLRRIGGGYSFIHRLLLDYFADLNEDVTSTPAAGPSGPSSSP